MYDKHITTGPGCNYCVNDRGDLSHISKAGPKDTSLGADLTGDATNKTGGTISMTKAESPNAKAQSANQ